MEISHVIRGQEWLPSVPKHILLYQAFGWESPLFSHMSHLLNKDRSKLSKRQGDVAVEDYRNAGYLPQALLNFLAITGWNEGQGSEQEIYTLDDLLKKFSLDKVHKTGAVFDRDKLDWINAIYIRNLEIAELTDLCWPYLEKAGYDLSDRSYVERVVALEQERIKKLSDLPGYVGYFFSDQLEYDIEKVVWKKSDKIATKENLIKLVEFLSTVENWETKFLEEKTISWIGDEI